jgi:hypothetical protein
VKVYKLDDKISTSHKSGALNLCVMRYAENRAELFAALRVSCLSATGKSANDLIIFTVCPPYLRIVGLQFVRTYVIINRKNVLTMDKQFLGGNHNEE